MSKTVSSSTFVNSHGISARFPTTVVTVSVGSAEKMRGEEKTPWVEDENGSAIDRNPRSINHLPAHYFFRLCSVMSTPWEHGTFRERRSSVNSLSFERY
jgi:hypothetical protein